jgi:CMP-N-acetylneuraminic acid synthetase
MWLKENEGYAPDYVVWLRPTVPMRTAIDIEEAIVLIQNSDFDCVRSVCKVSHHPYWMKKMEKGYLTPFIKDADEVKYYRRQLLPSVYRLNGAVDVIRCKINEGNREILFSGMMGGYIMPPERSVDLDSELDFVIAETLMKKLS